MFEHRAIVPPGAGDPPFCTCGVVGGNGITRPCGCPFLLITTA